MRKLILQMMTTLNGRIDKPFEWMSSVSGDHYRAIEDYYGGFDTVLVGRSTYDEMVEYWPAALASGEGTETNRVLAQRMHDYRKVVFSRHGGRALRTWNKAELAVARDNVSLVGLVEGLKAQPGKDIHLAGGGEFARRVAGLGLVDEFRLFVFPTLSEGMTWHADMLGKAELELIRSRTFVNGVVETTYRAVRRAHAKAPERFTELLA